jgi:hypothetical protein
LGDAEWLNNRIVNFIACFITNKSKIVKRKTLCGEGNIYYAACLRNSGNILGSSIFEMNFMSFSYVPPLLVKQV